MKLKLGNLIQIAVYIGQQQRTLRVKTHTRFASASPAYLAKYEYL